jgi:tetratricopeptide (TPR) repeat protein
MRQTAHPGGRYHGPLPMRVIAFAMSLLALAPGAPVPAQPVASPGPEAAIATKACLARGDAAGVDACRKALALTQAPERRETLTLVLAQKLATLGRWEEASGVYADVVRLRPRDAEARLGLAAAWLYGMGRAEDALAPLGEAADLLPDDPRPWIERGIALAALGRYAEAVAAFDDATRRDPSCLEARPAASQVLEAARHGSTWPEPEGSSKEAP